MTPSQLKQNVEQTGSIYFSRKAMRFFGDTMANYGVRSATIVKDDKPVQVWELWRKKPVKCGVKFSAYFDRNTFEKVHI